MGGHRVIRVRWTLKKKSSVKIGGACRENMSFGLADENSDTGLLLGVTR